MADASLRSRYACGWLQGFGEGEQVLEARGFDRDVGDSIKQQVRIDRLFQIAAFSQSLVALHCNLHSGVINIEQCSGLCTFLDMMWTLREQRCVRCVQRIARNK